MDEQYTVARKMYMSYILQGNEIGYIDGQMKSILLIYQQEVATTLEKACCLYIPDGAIRSQYQTLNTKYKYFGPVPI